MAMIPQIQQVVVKDKGWLSEEEMVDCIAVSQSMPGVIAINSATYIGRKTNGFSGAAAATTGVIAPSFLIIILIVSFLGMYGQSWPVRWSVFYIILYGWNEKTGRRRKRNDLCNYFRNVFSYWAVQLWRRSGYAPSDFSECEGFWHDDRI